jgi:hypothetical protein
MKRRKREEEQEEEMEEVDEEEEEQEEAKEDTKERRRGRGNYEDVGRSKNKERCLSGLCAPRHGLGRADRRRAWREGW